MRRKTWKQKLSKKEQRAWKQFQVWEKSWDEGLKAYGKIWKAWK